MQNCSALSESCSASFRGSLAGKESACNASYTGDTDSVPGLGRSPGEGNGSHSSILAWRIPDRGAWWATVHTITKSWTQLK